MLASSSHWALYQYTTTTYGSVCVCVYVLGGEKYLHIIHEM